MTTDFRLLAAKYLRKERGFKYVSLLGKGSYGTVIQMHNEDQGSVAVKLVSRKLSNSLESNSWQSFNHENILRLLFVDHSVPDCVIFVTELMSKNLTKHLQERSCREDPQALNRNKRYVKEILSGLDYLHGRHLCHLDLRADNIFLAFDGRAVIADFSGLCHSNEKKNFCPLPRCFRPPEMLHSKRKVWPKPIDLWSFGLLTAHVFFLKRFYRITLAQGTTGSVESAKLYVQSFQDPEKLLSAVKKNFPLCKIPPSFCGEFITFVMLFLQEKPRKRCQAREALYHNFLFPINDDQHSSNSAIDPSSIPSCSTKTNDSESAIKTTLAISTSHEISSGSSKETRRLLSVQTVSNINKTSESMRWKSSEAFSVDQQSFNESRNDESVVHICASLGEKEKSVVDARCTDVVSARMIIERPPTVPCGANVLSCTNGFSTGQQEDVEETSASFSGTKAINKESREFLVSKDTDDDSPTSSNEVFHPSISKSRWNTLKSRMIKFRGFLKKR